MALRLTPPNRNVKNQSLILCKTTFKVVLLIPNLFFPHKRQVADHTVEDDYEGPSPIVQAGHAQVNVERSIKTPNTIATVANRKSKADNDARRRKYKAQAPMKGIKRRKRSGQVADNAVSGSSPRPIWRLIDAIKLCGKNTGTIASSNTAAQQRRRIFKVFSARIFLVVK